MFYFAVYHSALSRKALKMTDLNLFIGDNALFPPKALSPIVRTLKDHPFESFKKRTNWKTLKIFQF